MTGSSVGCSGVRAVNVLCTNTTGKPIYLSIFLNGNSAAQLNINGLPVAYNYAPSGYAGYVSGVVPAGVNYYLNTGSTFSKWYELR